MVDCICNPLCIKHNAIRPCPICDEKQFNKENKDKEV